MKDLDANCIEEQRLRKIKAKAVVSGEIRLLGSQSFQAREENLRWKDLDRVETTGM